MNKLLRTTALAWILATLALAQAPRPPASWLDPDKSEPAGTHYKTFSSRLAGGEVSYLISLPGTYETEQAQRYPVVYWLHGLGGNQRAGAKFVDQLNAAVRAGKAPAMIVVLVNGMRDAFYNDSPDGKWPIESVIVKELIPHIDKTYRTVPRRESRAVEGYSMGGYGAAHLGFKYPDLFGIVGVMAGALIEPRAEVQPAVFEKMFGSDKAYVQANDPFALVRKNADAVRGRTAIRVSVGDQDGLQVRDKAFHDLLNELKIDHEWELVPGVAHNGSLFYEKLGERAFAYYQKALTGKAPTPGNWPNVSAQSRVLKRDDLEILTFETEQDYDRLQELYRANEATQPAPGVMTTLYYRSNLDGSVQPYTVRLPNGYSRDKKYPLVIQLHGTNFREVLSGARLNYHGMGGPQWVEPDLPIIYANAFGGPTTFYQGIGEMDVLRVIDEIKRRFPVDADRVYIMGHSMGGAGSYSVGLHYPDHFGGISAGDPAMWSKVDAGPDWMAPQMAIVSVPKLYPNARNVDVFFKNAGAGIQRRSTEFADGIVDAGGFATTEVFPRMPHSFGDQYPFANFVTEVIAHPIRHKPAEVKFYTNTLQYDGAYWVTIDRLTRHNADAMLTAAYKDACVSVSVTNIDALTLRLGEGPVPKGQPTSLVVEGREVAKEALPEVVHLSKQSGQWQIGEWKFGPQVKRHGLQGPIGDAFNSRFLAVYGDGDRDLAIAELDAIRNPPGPLDIHGDFPMKPASKVTRDDVESSNLILFGTAKSNTILKRIARSLPAGLMNGGGIFIYPNPENPSRYVVVWSAKLLSAPESDLHAGWIMPLNLLPDYVDVKGGKVASGGHFDNDWKLSDRR
jgi:enterochelin esterase-like enzyme